MWTFLVKNNLLPYAAILVLGYGLYVALGNNFSLRSELRDAEESIFQANDSMALIQGYNEARFDELKKIKNTMWEEGKHEGSY